MEVPVEKREKEGLGIVERPKPSRAARARRRPKEASRRGQKERDDQAQAHGHPGVGTRAGLDATDVQGCEKKDKGDGPHGIRHVRDELQLHGGLAAPDAADDGIHDVVEDHGPAGQVPSQGMQLAPHVGIGRAGAGIDPGHLPVAGRREQHGQHAAENGRDHMSPGRVADHPVARHGGGGLGQDQPVEDQRPKAQCAL